MKKLILSFMAIGLFLVISCGSDDESDPNIAPDSFTVSVSNVEVDQFDLIWIATTDPDGDDVSYDVYLEGTLVTTSTGEVAGTTIGFTITGLTEATAYSGVVTAKDGKGGTRDASYSLTTLSQ
ncbi:MAG: fibronectin type III domain-containing protein [Cytophagales bacterium]|nr:fibronectin type III domain-containing protein [Cytophagales bacterium]